MLKNLRPFSLKSLIAVALLAATFSASTNNLSDKELAAILAVILGGTDYDLDSDGDGMPDIDDAFPNDPNETGDSDKDGVGDNKDQCDTTPKAESGSINGVGCGPSERDSDGDGVNDSDDAFPNDGKETQDSDGDGVGDNSDAFPNDGSKSKAIVINFSSGGVSSIALNTDAVSLSTNAQRTSGDGRTTSSTNNNIIAYDESGAEIGDAVETSDTLFVAEAVLTPDGEYLYLLTSPHMQRALSLPPEECSLYRVQLSTEQVDCLIAAAGDVQPKILNSRAIDSASRKGIDFRADGSAVIYALNYERQLPDGIVGGTQNGYAWLMSPNGALTGLDPTPDYFIRDALWLDDTRIALLEYRFRELSEGAEGHWRIFDSVTMGDVEGSPVYTIGDSTAARGPLGLIVPRELVNKDTLEVTDRGDEQRVIEDSSGNFFAWDGASLRQLSTDGSGYTGVSIETSQAGAREANWYKQSGTGTDVKYTAISSNDDYLAYTKSFLARTPILSVEGESFGDGPKQINFLEGKATVDFGYYNKQDFWGVSATESLVEDVVINYVVSLREGGQQAKTATIPANAINAWLADSENPETPYCRSSLADCMNWANPEVDEEGFCLHKYGTDPSLDRCIQFNQSDNASLAYKVLITDMESLRETRYDDGAAYPEGNGNAFPGVQTVALIDGRLQAYFKDSRDHQYYIAVADADNFWENGDSALLFASAKNGSGDNAIITSATSLTLPPPLPLADVSVSAEISGERVTVSITLPNITDTQGYEFNRFAPVPSVAVKALNSVSPLTPLDDPIISADNTLSVAFAADDFVEGQIYLAELPEHFLVNGSVRRRTPEVDLLFNAPEATDVIRGRTIDGYIQGATIYLDINGNGNLDSEEPSGQSGDGGRFEISLNASQAACKNLAPVVADVPVGAVDESEGNVDEAYQMVLPPGTEALAAGQEINITPLTSILWAELYDLYNSGELPGLSCEELQNNPDAQAALQEKIEEAIDNAERAYNVPAEDLLGDFIASNSSQSQLTAQDIVEGLKWSLREKLRLEQLYPDAQHITVVFMRVPGTKFGDPNANPPDAYGWYIDYSIFEEKLIRRGIVRLDDTLTSELYTVFYRERYPSTLNMAGVEYRYARSLRLTDNPDSPYECWGQEFAVVRIEYGGHSEATPMGLGNMEYQIENETTMPVDSYEQCGPEVHQRPLLLQALQPTEWSRYRDDGIYKEGTLYRFQGDDIPLPHIRGFANDPDILTRETLIAAFNDLEWRFFEPASLTTSMEDKDLETDGQLLFIRKAKYPDDAPPPLPLGSWQRIERNEENSTQIEQWANAPFSTPAGCIDWESGPTQPPGNDVDPNCDALAYHEVTIQVTGEGSVSPAGPLSLPAGERLRATLQPAPGYALESVESDCGGSPHGITYLSDELTGDCSVSVSFVATEIDEIFDCPAEAWTEVGTEIPGEQASTLDADGAWSTGMNASGTVIAEGARYSDQGGAYSGQVRVFALVDGEWEQRGNALTGAAAENMGWDVALDAAGDTLVVGAPCERAGCVGGYTRVYDFDGDTWIQRGEDIVGLAEDDREGWSVAISDDGQRILTLSQHGTTNELKRASRVRVFDWQESAWQQVGESIFGPTDYTHPRVARLSQTGEYMVVGYPSADLQYPDSSQVTVRKLINNTWQQVGQALAGPMEGPFDRNLGVGVAISAGDDYLTLALGSDNGLGIFDLVDTRWVQRGSTITGPYSSSSQLGWGIEIRDSGNLIAASAVDGLVGVWGWKTDHWVQIGDWLGAGAAGTRDIGLSINGRNLVIAQQEFDLRRGRLKTYTQSGCLYASRNARRLKVDDSNSVSGNLITDDDGYGVDSSPEINELNVTEVDRTNGDNYGTLTFNADGSYTYTLDNNNAEVQSLSATDLLNEAYTYTLSDGVGGQKTGTLNVTIEGSDRRVEVLFDGEVGSTWYPLALNENGGYCTFEGYCSNWTGPINLSYTIVDDAERGGVIEIEHINDAYGEFAIGSLSSRDWSDFAGGEIRFDIRVIGETADNISDWLLMIYCGCATPVTLSNISPQGWQTISIRVDDVVAEGASLNNMIAPFAIWPDADQQNGVTYQLDNIRWIGP